MHVVVDQYAGRRRACLALVEEQALQRAGERDLEVGIGEDEQRILSAELHCRQDQRLGRTRHHGSARVGRAGE